MKCSDVEWTDVIYVRCSDVEWTGVIYVKWSDLGWSDVIYVKWFYFKVKWSGWSEVSYGEVLVDKGALYIRVTLYCVYLIILWLFHLGISCNVFVLICTVVVLCCFVIVCVCVCVCVGFVMCVFVWVLKCVGVLVICLLCPTEVFRNLTEVFLTLTEVFPRFFLSCKANATVKLAKTWHVPHSST